MADRRTSGWTPERRLDRLEWRVDALDAWRNGTLDTPGVDKRLAQLESEVVTEREARMLREALNANTALKGRIRLSRMQVTGGLVVGAIAFADLLRSLIG